MRAFWLLNVFCVFNVYVSFAFYVFRTQQIVCVRAGMHADVRALVYMFVLVLDLYHRIMYAQRMKSKSNLIYVLKDLAKTTFIFQ